MLVFCIDQARRQSHRICAWGKGRKENSLPSSYQSTYPSGLRGQPASQPAAVDCVKIDLTAQHVRRVAPKRRWKRSIDFIRPSDRHAGTKERGKERQTQTKTRQNVGTRTACHFPREGWWEPKECLKIQSDRTWFPC